MEKIKVKSVEKSDKTLSDGKAIYNVYVENDSKKYTCFNPEIESKVGQEIEATITEKVSGQYTNYIISLPKVGGGKQFVKTNSDRQKAIECAVNFLKDRESKQEHIIALADLFLNWLKKE